MLATMREIGRRQGENMDIESLEYLQTWREGEGEALRRLFHTPLM